MNITFFGDSISFGQGISVEQSWVVKLALTLNEKWDGKISVLNSSVNGNTTRMALERMPFDVQSHPMDLLVLGFGMNDCNYWETDCGIPRVSPDAFEANLKEIISRSYVFHAQHVILRTNHPSPKSKLMIHTDITYQESNKYYNSLVRKVFAEDKSGKTVFVDVEQEFYKYMDKNNIELKELVLPDEVHLSHLGHDLYYNLFLPVIDRLVAEQIQR